MRLSAFLRNLETDHAEQKELVLADGEHSVSQQTAQALANLAQFVAVHGIDLARETRDDLFVAVASSLLKSNHPGWSKVSPLAPEKTTYKNALDETAEPAVTVTKIDTDALWPKETSAQVAEYVDQPAK